MNFYGVIALIFAIIIFAHVFHAVEPISQFIQRISDVPVVDEYGNSPHIFKLAIRLAYLIVIVAVVKMFLTRKTDE